MSLPASLPARAGRVVVRVIEHLLPPTLYFFIAFNLIVFTTNLMIHDYWFRLSGFLVATTTALVVGKAVLVANQIRLIDRFRGAPLIQPILYRTVFYTLIVFVVRILERFIHLAIDQRGFTLAFGEAIDEFSWRRFAAIQIWLFTCFLIYVTATELSALLGEGQLFRLFFRHRSSEHRLTRRQHVRALMELSRLAETTPRERLLDPATPQGNRLVAIIDALRRRPG
ncbi:MAG TPA: hypothetical protein VII10_02365 [Reyranella sp.]